MVSPPDAADVVARRRDVLTAVSDPKTKPELVAELGASRSTVDRAIDGLLAHHYVERRGSEYVATYAGRQAVAAYERYLDRLDALDAVQPVLEELPPDVDIPPAVFEGANVSESTPEAPDLPVEENVGVVMGANSFRGTGPAIFARYIDVFVALADGGTQTELILTERVVDRLADSYPDDLATLRARKEIAIYRITRTLPYAVWTAEHPDRTVSGIIVYSQNGIAGIVNNDTPAMNEWATQQYERAKRDAELLS